MHKFKQGKLNSQVTNSNKLHMCKLKMPNQVTSVNNGKLSYKKQSTKLSKEAVKAVKAVKEDTKRYQNLSNCHQIKEESTICRRKLTLQASL